MHGSVLLFPSPLCPCGVTWASHCCVPLSSRCLSVSVWFDWLWRSCVGSGRVLRWVCSCIFHSSVEERRFVFTERFPRNSWWGARYDRYACWHSGRLVSARVHVNQHGHTSYRRRYWLSIRYASSAHSCEGRYEHTQSHTRHPYPAQTRPVQPAHHLASLIRGVTACTMPLAQCTVALRR